MPRMPFKLSTPPAPLPAAKVEPVIDRGAALDRSKRDGVTLFEAGAMEQLPDGEVGAVTNTPTDPGERPVYAPANPWPKAVDGKKPYKI